MNFKGVYTALVTPFHEDGSIDFQSLDNIVETQIAEGISGLVPMGTTGESPTLSHDEHISVIEAVVKKTAGRVPVIAGTGSNCTDEAIRITARARELGITASLQVAPYYNKPSQEGFYRHFTAIADAVDIPLIIYNIPGRSGKNIDNATMLRMAAHKNIVAVKEASGDIPQVMDLIANKPDDFDVLSGDDNLGFPIIALGGKGIISVASNIIPGQMEKLVRLLLDGRFQDGRKEFYRLLPLFKAMFLDTNPIPVKYGMFLLGKLKEVYRLPICEMSAGDKEKLSKVMKGLNLI